MAAGERAGAGIQPAASLTAGGNSHVQAGRMAARSNSGDALRLAVALALAGPATRIPLRPLHFTPLVPYAPFIVISAIVLGFGPGLLCTALCVIETVYYASQTAGSVATMGPANWERVVVVGFTGVFASVMAERLKQSSGRLKQAHGKTKSILDSISGRIHRL